MLSFDNAAAITAAARCASIDPTLRQLLADRIHDWTATGLLDLTHLLIVQPGDTEKTFLEELGWSPFVNPLDGRRFGSEGFVQPPFDWISDVGGHWELIQTVGNSGAAFCIYIPNGDGTDPELLALCRTFAEPA